MQTASETQTQPDQSVIGRLTGRSGVLGRVLRAGVTSIGATVLSHGTFIALVGPAHANATIASAVAFALGATFNYFVGRRFTWGRKERPHVIRETLPYAIVVGLTGLLSVGGTTLVQHLIEPLQLTHLQHTVVLELAFIASYGVVFLLKFTLLDRLVFRRS
jgi:putative flippase GtrA